MAKHKIVIYEIASNKFWNRFFPIAANVWMVNVENIYTSAYFPGQFSEAAPSSSFEFENIDLLIDRPIISVSIDKQPYSRVDTVDETVGDSAQSTFHYNENSKYLYIHFENHKPAYFFGGTQIELGFSQGFANTSSDWDGVTGTQQYKLRIKNSPLYKDSLDDPYFPKQKFQSSTVTLENGDLALSPFNVGIGSLNRSNNYSRVRLWSGDDLSDAKEQNFTLVNQSIVEEISEGRNITIKSKDLRASLDKKSPTKTLDTSFYPSIKDPEKKYIVPEGWGKIFRAPCLCLNEEANKDDDELPATATTYTFMLCDQEKPQTLSNRTLLANPFINVYIDGEPIATASLPSSVSTDANNNIYTFTLSAELFQRVKREDSVPVKYKWAGMNKVTVDYWGYTDGTTVIENGLDILENIIYDSYNWPYTSTFYDTETWDFYKPTTYNSGVYFNSPTTVQEKTEIISNDNIAKFVWNEDLRFSWDTDDFVAYDAVIQNNEFIGESFLPTIRSNSLNILSSFRVGYNKKIISIDKEDTYTWDTDDTFAAQALTDFGSTKTRDFETTLTKVSDVTNYQLRLNELTNTPDETFTVTVDWDYASILKSGDWVRVKIDLPQKSFVGWTRCKVQSIGPNIQSKTTSITFRIFEYIYGHCFNGHKLTRDSNEIIKG